MIRWSPMSSVFSMEPEGITRACPSVPLMSMKARITQNQAMASLLTLELMEASASLAEAAFVFILTASAFTIHLDSCPIRGPRRAALTIGHYTTLSAFTVCRYDFGRFSVGGAFADLELHQVRGIHACIAGRTKLVFGIADRLLKAGKREVAEGIGAEVFANLLRSVGRSNEFFARGRVHAVVAGRNRGRATDAHMNLFGTRLAHHAHEFATGGAAYDGVVYKDDALSGDEFAHGIQFELHAEIANGL